MKNSVLTYDREWPSVVPKEAVFTCLHRYYEGTKWTEPPVCAVCAQYHDDATAVDLSDSSVNLDCLQVEDEFIVRKCIIQSLSTRFSFVNPLLDGLMLDRQGIVQDNRKAAVIKVCSECRHALTKKKVPRCALANGLYRGELPAQFHDLTWVEEKICAIYCTTAHVTRLFQSSDPSQPKVFHGNTCAHDVNIISTASVLPRTPADVAGFLSVVFVGPRKFDPKSLGTTFRVRKSKIWAFLVWLKRHNRLYTDIPIDPDVVELYPDDGMLPGLSGRVV
ncbi:hypothetical protein L210DRAFT_3420646, partial [Boletus edulis BED1]